MSGEVLRRRFAELYGVEDARIVLVRGALHAKEIVMRLVALGGGKEVACAASPELERLAAIYGLRIVEGISQSAAAAFFALGERPSEPPAMISVLDESEIEFSDIKSSAGVGENIAVIRSLECAYGLSDAPCAALIAAEPLAARFAALVEPNAIPPIIEKAALEALSPSRLPAARAKIDRVRRERKDLAEGLAQSPAVKSVRELAGAAVLVEPADCAAFSATARAWKIGLQPSGETAFRLSVGAPDENQRVLFAFGAVEKMKKGRYGEVVRDTAETKIAASVDLDREGPIAIDTGIGFFDHMLTQIVHHAGVSASLACEGDLEVDAHHTIEDCAIAFGQALSQALGERRGVARFGFTLPMDEAEARVSIDLSGRPYLVFEGEFDTPLIGKYPTEMTEHVFRSLSQSLGAAIHLSVTGENDHHKTEACFKAFGRALRQAIRIEGEGTPSTKGVL